MLMMKKLKNLEFEPLHLKNVLLASVVRGIFCLFLIYFQLVQGMFTKQIKKESPKNANALKVFTQATLDLSSLDPFFEQGNLHFFGMEI
jgi:hypothetical protein